MGENGQIPQRRLNGKVAVITGAASGIGRASARRFSEEGANVVIADIDDEAGRDLAEQLEGTFVHADVTDPTSVEAMYASSRATYGGIDILFNNAGISPADDGSVLDTDLEAWRRVQEVNLTSVYLCCRFGIPAPSRARRRRGDQHRIVRRCARGSDVADLVHGIQGRRPCDVARAGRAVRS
jgi:NAD(P)-dependent dehydrogenase (short-subunit alcohol dehydrogenase family)